VKKQKVVLIEVIFQILSGAQSLSLHTLYLA